MVDWKESIIVTLAIEEKKGHFNPTDNDISLLNPHQRNDEERI